MKALGLPARCAYAIGAFALSGWIAFSCCMRWLPEYAANHPEYDLGVDGYGIFRWAVCVAMAIALTVALPLLTLPGIRRRRRKGRSTRIAFTGVVVVVASAVFADEGFKLQYALLFAAWLAYLMAFTFVRYGVVDEA